MRRIFTLFVLSAALCFGQRVPPIVVIPPHFHELGWREWKAYIPTLDEVAPKNETDGSLFARHPRETFESLHELDQEVCQSGPSDEVGYPNKNRCEGLI